MVGGFKNLPQVTALIRRKPAAARALPATVPAADVKFDEDGRRILTAPLQRLPGATVTLGPFDGSRKPQPPTHDVVKNFLGDWVRVPRKPVAPDDIPY